MIAERRLAVTDANCDCWATIPGRRAAFCKSGPFTDVMVKTDLSSHQ